MTKSIIIVYLHKYESWTWYDENMKTNTEIFLKMKMVFIITRKSNHHGLSHKYINGNHTMNIEISDEDQSQSRITSICNHKHDTSINLKQEHGLLMNFDLWFEMKFFVNSSKIVVYRSILQICECHIWWISYEGYT
jgi:hypothetical protein